MATLVYQSRDCFSVGPQNSLRCRCSNRQRRQRGLINSRPALCTCACEPINVVCQKVMSEESLDLEIHRTSRTRKNKITVESDATGVMGVMRDADTRVSTNPTTRPKPSRFGHSVNPQLMVAWSLSASSSNDYDKQIKHVPKTLHYTSPANPEVNSQIGTPKP